MEEMTNVAVDAMGGDHAPAEIVKGVVEAVNENSRIKVYLTGRQEEIKKSWYNIHTIKNRSSL